MQQVLKQKEEHFDWLHKQEMELRTSTEMWNRDVTCCKCGGVLRAHDVHDTNEACKQCHPDSPLARDIVLGSPCEHALCRVCAEKLHAEANVRDMDARRLVFELQD